MIDLNKVGLLLHVLDKCLQWPELRPLHDAAMAELRKLQAPPAPAMVPTPPPAVLTPEEVPAEEVEDVHT